MERIPCRAGACVCVRACVGERRWQRAGRAAAGRPRLPDASQTRSIQARRPARARSPHTGCPGTHHPAPPFPPSTPSPPARQPVTTSRPFASPRCPTSPPPRHPPGWSPAPGQGAGGPAPGRAVGSVSSAPRRERRLCSPLLPGMMASLRQPGGEPGPFPRRPLPSRSLRVGAASGPAGGKSWGRREAAPAGAAGLRRRPSPSVSVPVPIVRPAGGRGGAPDGRGKYPPLFLWGEKPFAPCLRRSLSL